MQRHSNSAKDFKRETKEHDRSSKERERVSNSKERDRVSKDKGRVSKERDSVSPRNSSSHSSLSHCKSADNVRENKDISKHKSIPERRKQGDTSNVSKVSPSKGNSSLRSSSKTNVADRGRNSSNKGRDNNTDKIPKKSLSSPNLQRNDKDKNKDKKNRNEDVKKKDTRTIKESVGKANVEKKPEKSKSDSVVVGSKVKVKTEVKEEKMDVEEQEPSVPKSPETPVEKGEKRSSETENTPRVVKKLKIEIDVANDNNNLTRVKTEKMETEDSKTSVASDIRLVSIVIIVQGLCQGRVISHVIKEIINSHQCLIYYDKALYGHLMHSSLIRILLGRFYYQFINTNHSQHFYSNLYS